MSALTNLGNILRLPVLADRFAFIDLLNPALPVAITATELDSLIVGVARGLLARGIAAGDRIAILSRNRLEFLVSYLGIMRAGAVVVPINHRLAIDTIGHIFVDSGIRFALTDAEHANLVPAGVLSINFDANGGDEFKALIMRGEDPGFVPTSKDLAEILYTSGSTGVPKGVPLTHAGQLWALEKHLQIIDETTLQQSTLIVAPLYHMNGLFFSTLALASRVTILSMPKFEARAYLETVSRWQCSTLSGIPTMFALMVREQDLVQALDLRCVREISIGSAPLTDALLEDIRRLFPCARIGNGYGTTEVGPGVFGAHPAGIPTPPLSLGHPMTEVECRLVDGPNADEGVLAVSTPALMHGYLNLPQVTAARMRGGLYLTGDVMRRDENGFYFFVGRADDMFVCGGENVFPGEVEKLLERHPRIAQAVVVGAPDDIKGMIPVAFVVPQPGSALTAHDVRDFALQHGPAYAHPRFVALREVLPVAGTHKIDRTLLQHEAIAITRAAGRSTVK